MQTLGLSDSTPRTENRLKSLFWPTIRNDGDLDYLTEQGFWICAIVAAVTELVSFFTGHPLLTAFDAVFFFLAGVGVRMRSRAAAVLAFSVYLLGGVAIQEAGGQGFGIVRIVFLALLLANIRGMWLSASWPKPETEAVPVRLNETWRDKLSDQLPPVLWPKIRWLFYLLAALETAALLFQFFPIAPSGSGPAA